MLAFAFLDGMAGFALPPLADAPTDTPQLCYGTVELVGSPATCGGRGVVLVECHDMCAPGGRMGDAACRGMRAVASDPCMYVCM